MAYTNPDILLLNLNKNFTIAYSILTNILKLNCPPKELLSQMYGEDKSEMLHIIIEDFMKTYGLYNKIPQKHKFDAPQDIVLARKEVERNKTYQQIHSQILMNKLPEKKLLEKFYGSYSIYVYTIIEKYLKLNLKRKCEISAASHLNRVGVVVFQLKMNSEERYDYSTVGIMHDSIEDLFKFEKNESSGKADIGKYNEFIKRYIPEDLEKHLKILTNHYNLILDYIIKQLDIKDSAISVNNILEELKAFYDIENEDISVYAVKLQNLLESFDYEKNLIDELKWECYKELYISGILGSIKTEKDHRIFEIKGVDLSDNAHGKGSLSIEGRIRNIKKNHMWAMKGSEIKSTWLPFNHRVQEVKEDALQSAEYLILADLLQSDSSMDFMMSALQKIKKLEDVFFQS